jgi:hypothetical protein
MEIREKTAPKINRENTIMQAGTGIKQETKYVVFEFPTVSRCSQIFRKLGGEMVMRDSEDQSGLVQYLKMNVAVVEVRHGESQEETWRRHLADHPESVGVRVKIFHYPSQVYANQKEKVTQPHIERNQSKTDKF